MKKLTALLLALVLCLSLAACTSNQPAADANSPSPDPSETLSQEEAETTPSEEPSEVPSQEQPSEVPSEEQPGEEPSQAPAEDQFALSSSDFTLFAAGESWKLTYTADPVYDESPVFTSSDESVATVDEDGVVTAVAPGKAVITATYGKSGQASCIVRCRWEESAASQAPAGSEAPSGSAAAVDLSAFLADLASQYGDSWAANASLTDYPDMVDAYYAGLTAISTKQMLIYQPMMGAVVCEIALVEVENAADVAAVKAIFQARIDAQVDGGAWYPASIEGWQNNSRVVSNGNYVMMIAWDNCDAAVSAFNGLF